EALVVERQQDAVGGDPPVRLEVAVAEGRSPLEAGQGVLAADLRRPAPVGEGDRVRPVQELEPSPAHAAASCSCTWRLSRNRMADMPRSRRLEITSASPSSS